MRSAILHAAMVVITVCSTAGCVGELELAGETGNGPPIDDGPATAERQAFNTNVLPAITNRTCSTCHIDTACPTVGENHCFLGAEQAEFYDTLIASTYLGISPASSLFANVGPHTGTGFCSGAGIASNGAADATCTTDQMTGINAWITLENGGAVP